MVGNVSELLPSTKARNNEILRSNA